MYFASNEVQTALLAPPDSEYASSPSWPVVAAGGVLALMLSCLALHIRFTRRSLDAAAPAAEHAPGPKGLTEHINLHVQKVGGVAIFGFKIIRLVSTAALLALIVWTALQTGWSQHNIVLTEALVCAVALAAANAYVSARMSQTISTYLSLITFAVFANYAYRDGWPLMTFTLRPRDESEGTLLWVKVGLAAWAGVLGPLLEPYPYIPLNRKGQVFSANPEQTASILSWVFWTFIDPTIWRAYTLPHLSHDQLPPLADYDDAGYLIEQHLHELDLFSGAKRGSMLWAIIRVLRVPLTYQVVCTVIASTIKLAGPIGVNRLLNYLESNGQGSLVRPWVWILWITMGPIMETVFKELYLFYSTRSLVRVEGLFTALIFDHALRLRMKADTSTGHKQPEDIQPAGQAKGGKAGQGDHIVGKIMNMATSDLANIVGGRNVVLLVIAVPLEIALSLWFLWAILSWSAIVGLGVMIVLLPVPRKIAKLMSSVQKEKMMVSDSRVQVVTEIMNVLRMIKLFGWEKRARENVAEKRDEELKWIWKRALCTLVNNNVNYVIPLLHMVVTFATYTLIMKRDLTASAVFSSLPVFDNIRKKMYWLSQFTPPCIAAYVSLGRLGDYLWNTELLDSFDDNLTEDVPPPARLHAEDLGLGRCEFAWSAQLEKADASHQAFRLRIDSDVVFQKGALNLIVGPTGCGKTSVLMALLGEMHLVSSSSEAWVNLPRGGGVAYAAQESWVLSDSIRDNIVFGAAYDADRYKKVIYQCALTEDLRMFKSGDATQVGEKGITLSGGQKARITLARAIYSSADVLLLDDILAALDVHTARWVVNKCLKGDLVKNRTVILVTHNIALTSPIAAFVLSMASSGRMQTMGSPSDVLGRVPELAQEFAQEMESLDMNEGEEVLHDTGAVSAKESKLVVAEEIALGNVSWSAYKLFLSGLSGGLSVLFWILYLGGHVLVDICTVLEMAWLGWWATQYAPRRSHPVDTPFYIGVYSGIVLVHVAIQVYTSVVYLYGAIRAQRIIHSKLMVSLLGSTFRWLDVTPISRVITRCTQDIQAVDGAIPASFDLVVLIALNIIVKMATVVANTPIFLLPAMFVVVLGFSLGRVYMKAQLSVKREMSNCKAPVLSTFGSAIQGLVSIRAYSAQERFRQQLLKRVNAYTRAARTFRLLNRWIAVRLDALSALFAGSVAFYFVRGGSTVNPSFVGFILAMAVSFTQSVLGLVHWLNEFEVNANSLERLEQYVTIEQEFTEGVQPPAYWPSSGNLHVQGLSASYSMGGPKVLQDITFSVTSGQRVGVVGRTGAGKSSLTLALLRCIPTDGVVVFDGVPTESITLDSLRSSITIIPQVPELMSGSLRQNLDPFNQHDDATLNDALRSAGLFSLQRTSDDSRITLDTQISGGGSNLSVGQRQIIALARAIVRQSKLLVLDEATSAIDYETDAVIQRSLRTELKSDVTVITIAHRLQTIMDYDMIMVLDSGRLVEYDTPKGLLQRQDGFLRALVEQSADKEALDTAAGNT